MITRTIQGVTYEVLSPCIYRVRDFPMTTIEFSGTVWITRTNGLPLWCDDTLNEACRYVADSIRRFKEEMARESEHPNCPA